MKNKYQHIRTVQNLEDEILKLKLKKNIIEQEMVNNVDDFKRSLSPKHLIGEALGLQFDSGGENKFFTILKSLALTFTAVRGGLGVFNRIRRIFKR